MVPMRAVLGVLMATLCTAYRPKVRIAYELTYTPEKLAMYRGYFEKFTGYDIEWIEISDSSKAVQQPIHSPRMLLIDGPVAQVFYSLCAEESTAVVDRVSVKEKQKPRPHGLSTVELLKAASSSQIGLGAHRVMQVAESLYINGYISYPRTESSAYPASFDLRGTLAMVGQGNTPWSEHRAELLAAGLTRPKGGHDAGDHPPITPMRLAGYNALSSDEWRVYEYVLRHFIGSVSRSCTYQKSSVDLTVGSEKFSCTGTTVLDPGFTEVVTWAAMKEQRLPELKQGDVVTLNEVKLVEGFTSPPEHITEAELITMMEKHGIGTDASIPTHVNNIVSRGYVDVHGARRMMVPRPLGIVLVHGYHKIDAELVAPLVRSNIESSIDLIATNKAEFAAVVQHALDVFSSKFRYFKTNVDLMDSLFDATFSTLEAVGKPLSRCGKCTRYMKHITSKPPRLHCAHCDETYNLPTMGAIKLFKELVCPLDGCVLLSEPTPTCLPCSPCLPPSISLETLPALHV